jgi:serine protease
MVRVAIAFAAASALALGPTAIAAPASDPGLKRQWPLARAVPTELVGDPSVVVAVLDTGITAHPDLGWTIDADGRGRPAGAVLPGYDFVSDPWSAADGDGWDPDPSDRGDGVRPAQAEDRPSCRSRVSSWHGTNVAGTIGAIGANQRGITGIASGARILPVRIMGRCGGNTADVAAAILWSAGHPVPGVPVNPHPARIINLSLSGKSSTCPRSLQTAIDIAESLGSVVVAAAGSAGVNTVDQTPANCENLIVVAATDRNDRRSSASNFGAEVTLSAPGGDMTQRVEDGIYTTTNGGRYRPANPKYGYYQGSSAAAAHVSGVLALLLSKQPQLVDVRNAIQQPKYLSAFKPGQCDKGDGQCGAGVLRLEKILADSSN